MNHPRIRLEQLLTARLYIIIEACWIITNMSSGNIFEKRLIEAYITENGSDPVTGEELSIDDLIELKSARVVRPRPPTQTSIPALLSTFQNEWDALALESYTLKQQLAQTRQELSTALYDYEGALRLIAKITKDRDEARDTLSKVGLGGAVSNGDAMQVDGQGLPEDIVAKIEETQKRWVLTLDPRSAPLMLTVLAYLLHAESELFRRAGSLQVTLRNLRPSNHPGQRQNRLRLAHVPLLPRRARYSTAAKMERLLYTPMMDRQQM
jgi:Prp19/Pso4-like